MRPNRVLLYVIGLLLVGSTSDLEAQTCAECWESGPFWAREHALLGPSHGGDVTGMPHGPQPPGCPGPHGECGFASVPALDKLLRGTDNLESDLFEPSSARFLEATLLNLSRSAIQVVDCEGHIIAHLPVSSKRLLLLETWLAHATDDS
jgi:hypothetical protein